MARGRTGLLALALLLLAAPAARAGSPRDEARAREHWERGAALYEKGDHEGAIAEWEEGYVLSERAEFLLNIAQAYREMKDDAKAVYYYRLYLKRKPDAPDAKEVREIVADLDRDTDRGRGDGAPGDGDGAPKKPRGVVTYGDDGRPIRDGGADDGADADADRDDGDDGDDADRGDRASRADDGRGTRRGSGSADEKRLRRELGSSYDAYDRSGLTVEGFRRVRTGSTLMVVGGVAMAAGVGFIVVSSIFDPSTRTPLEYSGYVGGFIALIGGAYLLYFGYAAWAAGGKMTRGADYTSGLDSLRLGVAPLRGGGAVMLSGAF